jgi:hypothetical protein
MSWLDEQAPEKVEAAIERLAARRDAGDVHAIDMIDYCGGDLRFAVWLWTVDRVLLAAVGLGSSDLEDWTYRDAFDDGVRPGEAARAALDYAGYGAE